MNTMFDSMFTLYQNAVLSEGSDPQVKDCVLNVHKLE